MRKSRTMWFSLALVVLGALMDNFEQLRDLIPPQYYGLSIVTIGVLVAIFRFLTTGPVGEE